jgi:hypothetical protein
LSIAEGDGKGTNAGRRRFFVIARGLALEPGSIQNSPGACKVLTVCENVRRSMLLVGIVVMLTKLGQRSHEVRETPGSFR